MADKQLMERAEQALYKVYNRFPVVFDHGEGVKLYDTEGNEYLDFGAGIAVMALGYGDEVHQHVVNLCCRNTVTARRVDPNRDITTSCIQFISE